MKHIILMVLVCLLFFSVNAQNDYKLKRSESFWGLHFDRHTQLTDDHIGASLTEEMVDTMLLLARPDYIQVDSKGHPGVSSYPTKVGQQAAGYEKDPLKLIRKVTDKHNVALYVHHSGVFDANYVSLNPEEARFGLDGEPDKNHTSFWGDYSDELLIPQIKELALDYELDGVWIDGESWAVFPDYQPEAIAEFQKETGITQIPKSAEDPNYKELLEFTRGKFIDYIRHYTTAVHEVAPEFQICSNWAFSAMMPDPVPGNIGLDFLSGDYDPDNSLNTANWNARCLAEQGMPFDLMAWSFVRPRTPKTALQLCQEAAAVISVGGGCQIYFRQNGDLSFQPSSFGIMKDIADFMLPRRAFCKDISIVPQVGLFYSTAGWKKQVDDVYRPFGVDNIQGVMNALLDGQQSVQVLMTHQLKQRMKNFPLIVVPEWEILESEIVLELKDYVKEGGKLLVIGSSSTKQFEDILQVKQIAEPRKVGQPLGYDNRFVTVIGDYREVECLPGAKEQAQLYIENDFRYPAGVVATVNEYGKGMVGGIYVDLGSTYLSSTSPVIRDLLSGVIAELNPELKVRVEGSHKLNVVTTEKDDKLLIQLVNTSGDHANVKVKGVDEIPALQNLKLSVLASVKPKSVLLQPEGIPLEFDFDNERVMFTIPEIKIHNIVEIR